MEEDSGAPYYRAIVLGRPHLKANGTAIVNVRYRNHKKVFIASCEKHLTAEVASVRIGDEMMVCPFDGDISSVIKHNMLVRWWILFWL